jgi:peptidoglycan biosynthesis protein MviN/MurJ (putative lipid II flippase)
MLIKAESYKKGIFLSTVFNIANKGLVFCNSLIIAFFFGAQLKMDIYFYAYNTIVILSAFITSLNASVLIPESMRLRARQGEESAIRFLNFFLYLYAAITILLCLIFLVNPVKTFTLVSGFDKTALLQQAQILTLSIPLIFLMPVINLLTDIMTSYKFFTIPMIAGIVNGLFSILFVVLFHRTLDVLSLLAGLLLSYSLNFLLLVSLMKKRLGWNFRFRRVRVEKRIWKNIFFAQAGNITTSLSSYAPLYLLSSFNGGIITSLNFAQQISSLPTTLITNQFSSVAGIKFNELYAKKEFSGVNRIFLSTCSFLIFILMPISGIVFLYSSEITSFLLERGAFHKSGVANTSLFLKYLGLLMPMLAINTFVARLFMAGHKIMEAFAYQVIFNCILILFIFLGIRALGIAGYPIAMVCLHLFNVLGSYFLLRFFPQIQYGKVLLDFIKIVGVNLLAFIPVLALKNYFSNLYVLLSIMIGSTLYILVLLTANRLLKVNPEVNQLIDKALNYFNLYKVNGKSMESGK